MEELKNIGNIELAKKKIRNNPSCKAEKTVFYKKSSRNSGQIK